MLGGIIGNKVFVKTLEQSSLWEAEKWPAGRNLLVVVELVPKKTW